MAINDILSVYRQSLASERQSRLAELQLTMQALQFEAAQSFREEGRQREDFIAALNFADQAATETLTRDSANIYSQLYNIEGIIKDSDGNLKIKKANKSITNLQKLGFNQQESADIYNVVQMYEKSKDNPALQQSAQQLAISVGRRLSRDYDYFKRSGYADESKSEYLKAMEKANILFKGKDRFQRDLSVDSFLGASQTVDALANIEAERIEMGEGDYTIDTPISQLSVGKQADREFFDSLLDKAGQAIINEGITIKDPVQIDISSPTFLEDSMEQEQIKIEETKASMADIENTLNMLSNQKTNIGYQKRRGIMGAEEASSQLKDISSQIQEQKNQLKSLNKLEEEHLKEIKSLSFEKQKRGAKGYIMRTMYPPLEED